MFRDLRLEEATPEALAPFGRLIGAGVGSVRPTSFYGDAVEIHGAPDFVSDADTCLSIARVRPRPNAVTWLERHFKHTQGFLPLNGAPYAVVVAPPGTGLLPDLDAARAFRFPGHRGFLMHVGTWHEFPFALERELDLVVLLRHETNRDLEAVADGEAVGADLEKRHVQRRTGVVLRIAG